MSLSGRKHVAGFVDAAYMFLRIFGFVYPTNKVPALIRREIAPRGLRFPAASLEEMLSVLRLRVSGCFADSIQVIKSLRAIGVRPLH